MAMSCNACKQCGKAQPVEDGPCTNPSKRQVRKVEHVFNRSGSKYLREVPCLIDGKMDVYAVLDAFSVTCPARQHAIKKLLCSGLRGKGSILQDLREANDAITRAIQMHEAKQAHLNEEEE